MLVWNSFFQTAVRENLVLTERVLTEPDNLNSIACLYILPLLPVVACGKPDIRDDHTVVEGDSYVVEHWVTYGCDEGYELNGNASRVCGGDGKWSGEAPACKCECFHNIACNLSNHTILFLDLFLDHFNIL